MMNPLYSRTADKNCCEQINLSRLETKDLKIFLKTIIVHVVKLS